MVISSRTPEGQPNHCPVCGSYIRIEPSDPAGEAPCPRCGHLLWFAWEDLGHDQVIRPTGNRLDPESLDRLIDSLAMRPGMRLVIDFSDVRYFASPVLGKLINLKKRLGAGGGRLCFRHVHPDLMEVFRITRLDLVFDLEP
jgi:anti-anti-sigma factor